MRKKARKTMGIVLALATLLTCLMVQGTDVNAGGPGYIPERGYYSTNEDEASNGTIVGPGGYKVVDGKSYNKLRFLYHHPIFKSYTEDTDSVVFYSDGFFDTTSGAFDPKNYNEHIASASMALAFSGMYLRANEEADANGMYIITSMPA